MTYIKFNLNGERHQGNVLSTQPKRTGTNRNWINIKLDRSKVPSSVDWNQVDNWSEIESEESVIYFNTNTAEFSQVVVDAKEKEIGSLIDNEVFQVVENKGQSTISSKWIITEKLKD